jgi:hypothetical protein
MPAIFFELSKHNKTPAQRSLSTASGSGLLLKPGQLGGEGSGVNHWAVNLGRRLGAGCWGWGRVVGHMVDNGQGLAGLGWGNAQGGDAVQALPGFGQRDRDHDGLARRRGSGQALQGWGLGRFHFILYFYFRKTELMTI